MIISRTKKLEALNNFTKLVGDDPVLAYLMGFLAGQVDRVHFVRDLRGADISLRLSQASLTVWPGAPFTASVGGVVVPHPVAFVKAVGQTNPDRQIFVSLSFDRADEAEWYQEVLLPDVSHVQFGTQAAEEKVTSLRSELDRALDIYAECKKLMGESGSERKKELDYYISVAETEMKQLSAQLEEVSRQLKQYHEA
ncbi:MAG TPA: hypothetical protein DEQ54_00515 [Firmicutes bacterium]|jgi:uncharacterized protein YpiB (UPF0302 family)|nr:hypothetical protein [Bacillota bacterium]HCD41088.1 hypothetical protein [Bacillota bacterium]HQE03526.1 hypothetical protein [Bacillota bacterium]